MKNKYKAFAIAILMIASIPTWWALWFMAQGAITPVDELYQTLGPALAGSEGQSSYQLLPSWPSLKPAVELLLDTPQFFAMFSNSMYIALPAVLGQAIIGAPAAWWLSRLKQKGRKLINSMYIALMLMPFQVTMAPNYLVFDRLGLMGTLWAVSLPLVFSAFPVFVMAKGFEAVPDSVLEAARIDGAGEFAAFIRIGLPLGAPGIASAAILGFLEAWSLIEQPMAFIQDPSKWPLSLYLPQIAQERLGIAMAASLVMLAPALLIFRLGQKYLELGIQSAGVKE